LKGFVMACNRVDRYRRLFLRYGDNIHMYCRASMSGINLELVHDKFSQHATLVRAAPLKNEKLSWQFLPGVSLFRGYDTNLFSRNTRVLSSVVPVTLFKFPGTRTVILAEYHTAGAGRFMERFRLFRWCFLLPFYMPNRSLINTMRFIRENAVVGMKNGLCPALPNRKSRDSGKFERPGRVENRTWF